MRNTATGLTVVDCVGSPYEIGRAHGETCRETIGEALRRWTAAIEERTGARADSYLGRFLEGSGFLAIGERQSPGPTGELRGLVEGSGQPFERILAYNLMDEEWTFAVETAARVEAGLMPGCTSVALAATGGRTIAQTMDIPSVHDGTQVALRISPKDGPEQIVFTAAGMVGLNGANASGVGVVVNSLAQLPSSRQGLPVSLVVRGILGWATAAEAAAFVESVPHATGQHYLIGDATEMIGLEAAADGVRRVAVSERYVHANHPLGDWERSLNADEMERASRTHARHDRAETLMRDALEVEHAEAVLTDREAPISCERRNGWMTFGGTSIAWDGEGPPTVRIAPGPPHETAWQTLGWRSGEGPVATSRQCG